MTTRFSLPPPRTGFLQRLADGIMGPARVWWRWFDNVHNTIDGGASGTLADLSNVPYALDQPHGPNTDVQLEQLRRQVNAIPNVAGQIADLKRRAADLEALVATVAFGSDQSQSEWNAGYVATVNPQQLQIIGQELEFITGPTIYATQSTAPVIIQGGTGIAQPAQSGVTLQISRDAGAAFIELDAYGAGQTVGVLGRQAGGSQTTPAATVTNAILNSVIGVGWDNASTGNAATFRLIAAELFTTTAHGTAFTFRGIPTGSTTLVEWERIINGRHLIGSATDNGVDALQVTGSGIFTGGIEGTTTNSNASAGITGEIISSTVTAGAAISLSTATVTNVTSIALTAGDWEVYGNVDFTGSNTTVLTLVQGSVTTASATLATAPGQFDNEYIGGVTVATLGADASLPGLHARASLTTTTTYYLTAKSTFTVSMLGAYGIIFGRRAR